MWQTNDPNADLDDLIFDKDDGGPRALSDQAFIAWFFHYFPGNFNFLLYIFPVLEYNISNYVN